PKLKQLMALESSLEPVVRDGIVLGKVVWVDHFGNLLTNIAAQHLRQNDITITCAGRTLPLVLTYADGNAGELTALVGSNGYLELAIPNGSAAEFLDAGAGLAVQVEVG
ncbi:MAG TPA: hypothetical protein EYN66_05460, partial [Myxococcales bacterium]|nr:hypothetical protein [Myxococcales bacterium]